jgi:anti-sigma-K factor RskA
MKDAPTNPELIDRLAAEYVLGTLHGAARRRFERWRATSAQVDERCARWEQRLLPLLRGIRPITPAPRVWAGIRARLGLASLPVHRRVPRRLAIALAASVLLVALGSLVYWRSLAPGPALEVATITTPTGSLLWRVELYGKPGAAADLSVRAGVLAPPAGHDYELWALPQGGRPVSLGVLPYGEHTQHRTLTALQQRALAGSIQLAVSIEPPGGSATGQPTGAVVFLAPLRGAG